MKFGIKMSILTFIGLNLIFQVSDLGLVLDLYALEFGDLIVKLLETVGEDECTPLLEEGASYVFVDATTSFFDEVFCVETGRSEMFPG